MSKELEGQMTLFDLADEQPDEQCAGCYGCRGGEPCKQCGGFCTSSRECIELAEGGDERAV